jgi:hypothetical protein
MDRRQFLAASAAVAITPAVSPAVAAGPPAVCRGGAWKFSTRVAPDGRPILTILYRLPPAAGPARYYCFGGWYPDGTPVHSVTPVDPPLAPWPANAFAALAKWADASIDARTIGGVDRDELLKTGELRDEILPVLRVANDLVRRTADLSSGRFRPDAATVFGRFVALRVSHYRCGSSPARSWPFS